MLKVNVSTMPMRITTRLSVSVYTVERADSQAISATRPSATPASASGPIEERTAARTEPVSL